MLKARNSASLIRAGAALWEVVLLKAGSDVRVSLNEKGFRSKPLARRLGDRGCAGGPSRKQVTLTF